MPPLISLEGSLQLKDIALKMWIRWLIITCSFIGNSADDRTPALLNYILSYRLLHGGSLCRLLGMLSRIYVSRERFFTGSDSSTLAFDFFHRCCLKDFATSVVFLPGPCHWLTYIGAVRRPLSLASFCIAFSHGFLHRLLTPAFSQKNT